MYSNKKLIITKEKAALLGVIFFIRAFNGEFREINGHKKKKRKERKSPVGSLLSLL